MDRIEMLLFKVGLLYYFYYYKMIYRKMKLYIKSTKTDFKLWKSPIFARNSHSLMIQGIKVAFKDTYVDFMAKMSLILAARVRYQTTQWTMVDCY